MRFSGPPAFEVPKRTRPVEGETGFKSLIDVWAHPVTINRNNFKYKSLSCWAINPVVGCAHSCLFCFVPSTSTNKMRPELAEYGVDDSDAQWGEYSFFRTWDENEFLRSLRAAERTPLDKLNGDGNRAVILSTTTDPYQVVHHPDPKRRKELFDFHRQVVRRCLELIRDRSTINVRILTRSPLARCDFELFQSFGKRLVFGMSIPTLNNKLAKVYEPGAPSPTARLSTLRAARDAGLNIYVAIAPTYPECTYDDLKATMRAIGFLDPITIFHEPINIRAENVTRILKSAAAQGVSLNTAVFDTRPAWRNYARESLALAWQIGTELGLQDRLHLWPDANLGSDVALSEVPDPFSYLQWLQQRWNRISEWPI